jgi:hypothetical protein
MADEGRSAEWDEVGRRFGNLGHRLQDAWVESRPAEKPASDEESGRGVSAALDELKTSISHTVSHPEVRAAAENATAGFTGALATNLRQLADWLDQVPRAAPNTGPSAGGDIISTDKPET